MTSVTTGSLRVPERMSGMSDQPSRWFRLVALLTIVVLAIPQVAELVAGAEPQFRNKPGALWLLGALALSTAAALAYAFWRVTSLRPGHAPRWVPALLALQMIAAAGMIDFLPVIAAEIGYMLPVRQAWRWYGVLLTMLIGLGTAAWVDGSFETTQGLTHLPFWARALATIVELVVFTLFAFVMGRFLAIEREQREAYAQVNDELQATRELLAQTSRTGERLRIARELHDTLGHHLTALAVNLELAGRVEGAQSKEVIGRAHLLSKLLLNDVRDTVAAMRQERAIDLPRALRAMTANVPTLRVHMEVDESIDIDPERAHVLLRCAQEALTNVVRHAKAGQAWMTLARHEGRMELTVRNDGPRVKTVQPGNGLLGMRERLTALGGSLEFGSRADCAFEVRAMLPFEEQS